MEIYDTITADAIEDGDQILIDGEPVEDVIRFDDTETGVFINGYSHDTGDRENYELPFDAPVDLWTV